MIEDTYSELVRIESDHPNGVENFIHEMKKQTDEASRFGVEITVTRVQEEVEERGGFDES
jgi:hypothetical protein